MVMNNKKIEGFGVMAVEFNLVKKLNNGGLDKNTRFLYNGTEYILSKHTYGNGDVLYSVNERITYRSMNVDKATSRYISLYTYDMMSNRTNFKLPVDSIMVLIDDEKEYNEKYPQYLTPNHPSMVK
jgi:hypothetical protein